MKRLIEDHRGFALPEMSGFLSAVVVVALLSYLVLGGGPVASETPARPGSPIVSLTIRRSSFYINGQVTSPDTKAQGLLLNSRMIQGVYDDENPLTVAKWAYPDTHRWDPQRNTDELIAALPKYAKRGLKAITVGLQGGCPICDITNGTNVTSGFDSAGNLKPAWTSRLNRLIKAADKNGIVVIVSYFYFRQDRRLSSNAAVAAGVRNATAWLVAEGYTNVMVEIANECDSGFSHHTLDCGGSSGDPVRKLIQQAQIQSAGKLKVSVSQTGGTLPSPAVINQEDYVTVHGNGQSAAAIINMINALRAETRKPIVFDEDSTDLTHMGRAVKNGASWGYYDQGLNNYQDGYQSPPVNWGVNTTNKINFFNRADAFSR